MLKMKLAAVITDIDGTIAETEDYHLRAYNDMFAHLGLAQRWTQQDYADRLAQVGGAKIAEIMGWLGVPDDQRIAKKRELYDWKSTRFHELVVADVKSGALPVRDGILPLFEAVVAEGVVLAAASTCVKPAAIAILEAALGPVLFSQLKTICAGDDVAKKKPAPDIYLMAAQQCRIDPRACLAIEDTSHGLASAKAAGMSCIVTPSAFAHNEDFSVADAEYVSLANPQVTVADLRVIHERSQKGR